MPCAHASNTATRCLRAAVLAASIALVLAPAIAQSKAPASREELIQQIQSYADGDVAAGAQMNAESAVSQFQDNTFGVTAHDIREIYRKRYLEDREKKKPLWDRVPPWLYVVGLVLAFFWRPLKNFIEESLKKTYEALYTRYAGAKLFRGPALARYRASILNQHVNFKIPFRDAPLKMREVYVPLRVSETGSLAPVDAIDAVRNNRRLMVKGAPGSGKSMLLRALLLSYADARLTGIENDPVPVLVELSRLNDATTNVQKQLVAAFDRYGFPKADSFITWALEHKGLLLLLDGLDEVNAKERSRVVQDVNDLVRKHECRFVVTCRSQVYRDEFASSADRTLEVAEFSDHDILRFLKPWTPAMTQDHSVEQLMQTLRDRPRILLLARNPLLLTMIAYLYADQHMILPHSRAEFYRYSTTLLLEKWQGMFNRFGVPAKSAVLSRLALRFQAQPAEDQDRRTLTFEEVLRLVREVLPGTNVKSEDAGDLLDEIVDRSGLLLRLDGGTRFQFTHLTIQEYFAATARAGDRVDLLQKFRSDRDTWREVVKLWCGLAQDSTEMIREVDGIEPITAIECLADARYIKPEVADHIVDAGCAMLQRPTTVSDSDGFTLVRGLGLLAGVPGPRGTAVLDWLTEQLAASKDPRIEAFAGVALAYSNLDQAAQRLLAHNSELSLAALVGMGDVAVRPLLQAKNSELLVKIGTPRALEATVSLLWDEDDHVCVTTASYLARKFADLEVEAILRDVPSSFLGPRGSSRSATVVTTYGWIWEPFRERGTLREIAARIGVLLDTQAGMFHKLDLMNEFGSGGRRTIDPRLALPLYASTKNQIFMHALPEELRKQLQERIAKLRKPTRDDWIRIFQPTTFNFAESRHMQFFKILYSAVLLAWLFCLYKAHAFWLPFAWWKLGVIAEVVSIPFISVGIFLQDIGGDGVAMLAIALMSEMSDLRSAINCIRDANAEERNFMVWFGLPVACCAPLVIYFCSRELHKFFSWPAIAGLWIALYAVGATVWWMGRRKERLAKNPLQGLIEPPKFAAPREPEHFSIFGIRLLSRRAAPAMAGSGHGEASGTGGSH